MASEYFECKAERSTTAIHDILEKEVVKEEAPEITSFGKYGNEPDTSGNQFGDIHTMKLEIVEEDLIETKPFRDYGVFNKCLGKKEKEIFHDSDSSEFRNSNSVNPKESKHPPTDFWKNMDFNVFAGELAKPTVNHLDNEIIWKNEDKGHSKCTKDSPVNSTEMKTEYDIDIIYEDVKPHLTEEKSSGKIGNESNPITDVIIGTNIEANLSREFSKDFWENGNFNDLANELAKQKVNHFDNGVIVKYEDHSEGNDESLTNNVELKMKTLKNEDDIDIFYEDVKPEICDAEANGKSENGSHLNSDILIGTEIGPNFSYEFSKDSKTWPQQNIEEDGTVPGSYNDTRKESTVTIESKNCRMIQNLPHCRYTEFHSFDSKQDFNEIPDTEKKQFQCSSCSKTFTKKNIFLHHERIHTGEKPFQCKICSKSFTAKSSLLYHDRLHKGENPFLCKICLKSFKRKGDLTRHEIIHSGEKQFQCKACPKSFIRKEYLTKHERIHTGVKPFHCRVCQKSFADKSVLLKHERIHTREKTFQCKLCSESFRSRKLLLIHEMNHTGEKLYQCKVCPKSFDQLAKLTQHKRIHTRVTFQCQICPKSFNDNGNLMNHERMHAVENLFNASFVPVLESRKKFSTDLSNQHSQVKYI